MIWGLIFKVVAEVSRFWFLCGVCGFGFGVYGGLSTISLVIMLRWKLSFFRFLMVLFVFCGFGIVDFPGVFDFAKQIALIILLNRSLFRPFQRHLWFIRFSSDWTAANLVPDAPTSWHGPPPPLLLIGILLLRPNILRDFGIRRCHFGIFQIVQFRLIMLRFRLPRAQVAVIRFILSRLRLASVPSPPTPRCRFIGLIIQPVFLNAHLFPTVYVMRLLWGFALDSFRLILFLILHGFRFPQGLAAAGFWCVILFLHI